MPQTLTLPTLEEIFKAIEFGAVDDGLDAIRRMAQDRQDEVNSMRFGVGARVVLNSSARPAYLRKIQGTIVKMNEKSAMVQFEPTDEQRKKAPRYSFSSPIRCPLPIIDLI